MERSGWFLLGLFFLCLAGIWWRAWIEDRRIRRQLDEPDEHEREGV